MKFFYFVAVTLILCIAQPLVESINVTIGGAVIQYNYIGTSTNHDKSVVPKSEKVDSSRSATSASEFLKSLASSAGNSFYGVSIGNDQVCVEQSSQIKTLYQFPLYLDINRLQTHSIWMAGLNRKIVQRRLAQKKATQLFLDRTIRTWFVSSYICFCST